MVSLAHPGIKHPHSIPELTYKEMRELAWFQSYMMKHLFQHTEVKIPLVIKKYRKYPDHPGTHCFGTFR